MRGIPVDVAQGEDPPEAQDMLKTFEIEVAHSQKTTFTTPVNELKYSVSLNVPSKGTVMIISDMV